ncbi:MAG: RDD family protein [Methylotenera sp.]|nr:RDD family protein [Methylotenera sp.]
MYEPCPIKAPSLFKLGACFFYEVLVVIALAFACGLVFVMTVGNATHGEKRIWLQLILWLAIGVYFVWCWHRSGQTLAMKTWKLQVLNQNLTFLSLKMAAIRYLLATLSLMLFGLGFIWAVIDKDHLFLHDRLLKNKLISISNNLSS